MTFEIIKKEVNAIQKDCFDLSIINHDTNEIVVFDCVKIWDEDQQSLEDMFYYDESLDA
jgi:hypothetical protein